MTKRVLARWALAGPLAFIAALLLLAGAPTWAPKGAAGIDNLVIPLILFPAFWGLTFFYAVLEERLWRSALVLGGLSLVNGALVYRAFTG